MDVIPPKPNSLPIPKGHLRLYHQPDESKVEVIRTEGLSSDASQSQNYGEPEGIWTCTNAPFYGGDSAYSNSTVLEFDIPADDPRIIKEAGSWPHPESQEHIEDWNARHATVLLSGRIEPHEMRMHEQWHGMYRTLDGQQDTGQYDTLISENEHYAKAIALWKSEQDQALDNPDISIDL